MVKYYIGTSGWSYLDWVNRFYPKKLNPRDYLSYYANYFNAVEINVTFYRIPPKESFKRWYKLTPPKFYFTVKAPRFITHIKKLRPSGDYLDYFFKTISVLKAKLKVILFQLPTSLKYDIDTLQKFIKTLPTEFKYAFEFRKDRWFTQKLYAVLKKHKSCLSIPIAPKLEQNFIPTTNYTYIRLHGKKNWSKDLFNRSDLNKYLANLNKMKGVRSCFVFFNNDFNGYAIKNAKDFKKLTE